MKDSLKLLSAGFYNNSTISIAEKLLGKFLVRQTPDHCWIGKIVEVEAYIGEEDPACHAYHGLTPRTTVMYGPPGHAYVYFTYGMYFMLNVVTEREGIPAAVLIRAVEPCSGFEATSSYPANGPGKLCRSMQIDKSLNGISLRSGALSIRMSAGREPKLNIRWSSRIGITEGKDRIWRAYIQGNPHVSRKANPHDLSTANPL